jgi:hypothetical protein
VPKPAEANKINYIVEMVNEQRTRNKKWGDYAFFVIGAIGLSYMASQSFGGAALGGWFAWFALGARLAIIDAVYRAARNRAMAKYDGVL